MVLIASEADIHSSPLKYKCPPKTTTRVKDCHPDCHLNASLCHSIIWVSWNLRSIRAQAERSSSTSSLGGEVNLSRKLPAIRSFLAAASICNNVNIQAKNLAWDGTNRLHVCRRNRWGR